MGKFWWSLDLQAAGFTDAQASQIRDKALQAFKWEAPADALNGLDQVAFSPAKRKEFIQSIFARGSMTDSDADKLLALLKTDEDWLAANEQINRRKASSEIDRIPMVNQPAQWLADFGKIDLKDDSNRQYNNMLSKWDDGQIKELVESLRSQPEATQVRVAEKLANNLTSRIPERQAELYGEAIRILATKPADHPELIRVATHYAMERATNDPAAAGNWVTRLPAGDARDWVRNNLAAQWSATDPTAAERWISSLPKVEQSRTREFLKDHGGK